MDARIPGPTDLAGEWAFDRRLRDARTGQFGSARGHLVVNTRSGTWIEAGELTWGGRHAPVTRTLRFTRFEGEWWLTFADGRRFHPWRFGVVVEHPCGADVYYGRLATSPDTHRLRIAWDVRGPAKDQRIITRHRRTS